MLPPYIRTHIVCLPQPFPTLPPWQDLKENLNRQSRIVFTPANPPPKDLCVCIRLVVWDQEAVVSSCTARPCARVSDNFPSDSHSQESTDRQPHNCGLRGSCREKRPSFVWCERMSVFSEIYSFQSSSFDPMQNHRWGVFEGLSWGWCLTFQIIVIKKQHNGQRKSNFLVIKLSSFHHFLVSLSVCHLPSPSTFSPPISLSSQVPGTPFFSL